MSKPVCAVIGIGPGNGTSLARRFAAGGYAIAMLSRSTELSSELANELDGARAFACDASLPKSIASAFEEVRSEMGDPEVVVYNAGSGVFGNVEQVDLLAFETAWQVNARGLFCVAREVVPAMKAAGKGTILVVGATASLRGGANFAAFAAAKGAQRNLAQAMARHLAPSGIHVGLLIIDGMVDLPRSRQMLPDAPDAKFMKPDSIADTAFMIHAQDPSAWTFELDLRPSIEKW